jgi:rSAM/selenodomain-associated transferase 2
MKPDPVKSNPHISVIVPVFNETDVINGLIDHVRSLDRETQTEIIVVDGHPAGNTLNAVQRPNIVKVMSAPGRGTQLNAGAERASGVIVLFLHADTELPGDAFRKISHSMETGKHVAGAFRLGIRAQAPIFRIIEFGSMIRSGLTRVPFGDQAIFMRRSYFREIGGYRDIPIMEDVDLMVRIRARKDKIVIIPEKVSTSSRRWEQEGVLRCVVRNWFLRSLYLCRISPQKLARFYTKD